MSSTGRSVLNLSSDSSMSKMSQRMSEGMSKGMKKVKAMDWDKIWMNGALLLVAIGVLTIIGMSIYKDRNPQPSPSTDGVVVVAEDRLTMNDYDPNTMNGNQVDDIMYQQ